MYKNEKNHKRLASQTWPKRSHTSLHSTLKLVRRIRSSKEWIRSNPAALKPKYLEISISQAYKCQRQTSFLSILGLEVQLCLSVSSKACKVPTSAIVTFSAFSLSTTSAWRRRKANYGSLGSSTDPYSKLKVEWMKYLASNSLSAKSSALLLASVRLASTMALSLSLVWPKKMNL